MPVTFKLCLICKADLQDKNYFCFAFEETEVQIKLHADGYPVAKWQIKGAKV